MSAVNEEITHEQSRNVLIRRPSPIQTKIMLIQLKLKATRRRKQPYVLIRGKSVSLLTRVQQLMSSTPKHKAAPESDKIFTNSVIHVVEGSSGLPNTSALTTDLHILVSTR